MYGYEVVQRAETERVDEWTDISKGSIYGAIKRAADDGLLEPVRTERPGRRPQRQVYGITDAGRSELVVLRDHASRAVAVRADPFDFALARLDDDGRADIAATIDSRLTTLHELLRKRRELAVEVSHLLTFAEMHALRHRDYLLEAEIAWHEELRSSVGQVQANQVPPARQERDHPSRKAPRA